MGQILKIKTSEGWHAQEDPLFYLRGWAYNICRSIEEHRKDGEKTAREIIFHASKDAKTASGFECIISHLQQRNVISTAEHCLEKMYHFAAFLENPENLQNEDLVDIFVKKLSTQEEGYLLENMIFCHHRSTPFDFDLYAYRNAEIRFSLQLAPVPEDFADELDQARFEEVYRRCQTESQRKAILTALEIVAAKKIDIPLIKVKPRTNLLICGPSGSGKSWLVDKLAYILGVRIFTSTPGSWHLRGGTGSERPTALRMLHALEDAPCLLVLDEAEKYRKTERDNGNYFRSVLDEVYALMDGRLSGMHHSATAAANLAKSVWVAAGAFQDLYRERLGDITFAEEVDEMTPLTFQDIQQSGWLPDELISRFACELIEIRPPTTAETLTAIRGIAKVSGVAAEWTDKALMDRAQEIVVSMQSVRGIERFALDCARARVRKDVASLTRRK